MKTNAFFKLIKTTVLTILLVTLSVTTALAYGNINVNREGSISVYFGDNGEGFPDVEFSLYRVARVSADGTFTLTGDFRDYSLRLNDLDSSDWRALAQTLDAYVARDDLEPLRVDETGRNGEVTFSDLSTGLYLIIGERYVDGRESYTPEPMLVALPGQTDSGRLDYSVDVSCKYDNRNRERDKDRDKDRDRDRDRDEEEEEEEEEYEYISLKVQKVWNDYGSEDERPEEIDVYLMRDGVIVDTVTLSRETDWEYSWDRLDAESKWQVIEAEVPEGYTMMVMREGNVFVMSNSRPPKIPEKLPQTGMLWWPVSVLSSVGLILIVIGLIIRSRQGDSDEK